ncbi:MAG: peptide/nickel transport system substrate-binding protein [Haloarculaceae archaeon]|jgi:peptide/nickel transport system substrate-binding protein
MERRTTPVAVRRRDLLKALAASGVAVSVAGCSETSDSEDGGDGETPADDGDGESSVENFEPQGAGDREYISGSTSAAQNLSPLSIGDEATSNRLSLFYDGGGDIDDAPEIAFESRWFETWELSEDAQTVSYRLRDNLQWGADYGQLTAEDYVYSVRNVFTADWAQFSQRSFFSLDGEPIEYEQTGELTFEASLPQPRANWLHEDPLMGSYPLPKSLVEKYEPSGGGTPSGEDPPRQQLDNDPDVREAALAGNLGPFKFESWEKGQKLEVSANEDYYLADSDVDDGAFQGSPQLDSVTIQVFDEQSTAYSALRTGDITTTGIEERKVSEFEDEENVKLWTTEFGSGIFWLNVNHRVNGWPPLRESREVRQAIAHLFDKETLINQIFDGFASPAHTFHPTWGPYYSEEKIDTFDPNVEQARQKLESGTSSDYGYDGSGTFRGPDGEQVELRLVIDNTNQTGRDIGNFLRTRFEEAGISLDINGLPFGQIIQTYLATSVENNPNYSGEPDYGPVSQFNGGPWDQAISSEPWDLIYGVGFSTGAYAPWQVVKGVLTEQGAFNFIGYAADDFDVSGAVSEAASASSQEEATQALSDLFGYLSRDQPLIWSFTEYNIAGYRQPIEGLPEVENFFSRPNVRLLSLSTQ